MAAEDWFDVGDWFEDIDDQDSDEYEQLDENLPFSRGRRQFQGRNVSQPEFGRFKPKDVKNMRVQIPLSKVNLWRTAGGEVIQITAMTDGHLLSAIHMFERNRERDLAEIQRKYTHREFHDPNVYPQMVEHYSEYPAIYHAMVAEGCKRGIVARNYELVEAHKNLLENHQTLMREHTAIVGKLHSELEELRNRPPSLVIDSLTGVGEELIAAIVKRNKKVKKVKRNARSKSRPQSKKKSTRKAR